MTLFSSRCLPAPAALAPKAHWPASLNARSRVPESHMFAQRDSDGTVIQMPFVDQGAYKNLCWAACCAMVFRRYGIVSPSLCGLSSQMFGAQCAQDCSSSQCDQACWPDETLANFKVDFRRKDSPLTLGNVMWEINAQRPVAAIIEWDASGTDQGRHMVLVTGYFSNSDVFVLDPLNGKGRVGFDYVAAGYNEGEWTESYYNLAPLHG